MMVILQKKFHRLENELLFSLALPVIGFDGNLLCGMLLKILPQTCSVF